MAVSLELGLSFAQAARGLEAFTGTKRRFERKGTVHGVEIIDDYAHHPDEIAATLKIANGMKKGKLWLAFQSHTYTRTAALFDEFVEALYGTTVNITTATKQPLVSKSAREYIFQMCMQTDEECNFFDVPASWNLTSITTWNPITSLWNNVDFEFDATDVTHEDAGGNTIAYKRYTDNRHAGAVGRRIKITWGA